PDGNAPQHDDGKPGENQGHAGVAQGTEHLAEGYRRGDDAGAATAPEALGGRVPQDISVATRCETAKQTPPKRSSIGFALMSKNRPNYVSYDTNSRSVAATRTELSFSD